MKIKLLVRLAMAILLVLAVAHCRQPREPLYTCNAGDPTCDFDSKKAAGKGKDKNGDARPSGGLGARTPPEVKDEEEIEPTDVTTNTDSEDDSEENSEENQPADITLAQTNITVKLALLENNKDGVEFRLIYKPFDGVIHRDFSIGQGADLVEYYPSTEFQERLSLELKIRVKAEYEHEGNPYCAHFDLSKSFSDYGDSTPAVPSEGECQ